MSAQLVYLDTNVFILGFESPTENAQPVQQLLSTLRDRPVRAITSEITLAELLAPINRPHALPSAHRRRLYLDLLLWSGLIDLRPVTREILIETADLRQVTRQKLPDAIHVVTAIRASCAFFLSHDNGMKGLPHTMQRLPPDDNGIGKVLEALSQSNSMQSPRDNKQ